MKKTSLIFFLCAVLTVFAASVNLSVSYAAEDDETVYLAWDFENGITGWTKYIDAKVEPDISPAFAESNALSVDCSYVQTSAYNWNEAPMFSSPSIPDEIGQATHLAMDIYSDQIFTDGSINITPIIQSPQHSYWNPLTAASITPSSGTSSGVLKKYELEFSLDGLEPTDIINYLVICPAGVNTSYSGKLYFDNIRFISHTGSAQSEFDINQISVRNPERLLKNEEIRFSCTAKNGTKPYYYTFYALKNGKICYKSSVWQSEPSVAFTLNEAGEYMLIAYCRDSGDSRTRLKKEVNVTVYNDESEIPVPSKLIALTFDDGPDGNAGMMLDVLEEKGVKATFFVLHTNAQNNTALLRRAYEEGHQIGNHTYNHLDLTQLSRDQAIAEIENNNNFIESVTGEKTNIYRPPYLAYNSTVLNYFPDMTAIGCSIDSRDWSGISKDEIISNVVSNASDGDIVLMHEPQANTRAAVGEIIDRLRADGFEFVTVDELFSRKNKTMNGASYYSFVR